MEHRWDKFKRGGLNIFSFHGCDGKRCFGLVLWEKRCLGLVLWEKKMFGVGFMEKTGI